MELKRKILAAAMVCILAGGCILAGTSALNSPCWIDYLGNSQRTGYSSESGPDTPEIFWKTFISGDFDTSPFIIGDKILILWKNNMYHLSSTKVILLDLITGEVLQECNPSIPENVIFDVFPIDSRIIGISGTVGIPEESVYEIDPISKTAILLTKIPERYYSTPNRYPVILKDKIIIPTLPLVCLSRHDFSLIWSLIDMGQDSSSYLEGLAGDETIVVIIMVKEEGSELLAVDPSSGALKWTSEPLPSAYWLVLGEDVYCGGQNLWAFDRDGSELWHFTPEERIASNIVLGPDGLYIADYSNKLYKIDLGGNLIWKTWCEVSPWYYETHLFGAGDILYCFSNFGGPDSVSRSCVTAFRMEDGYRLWEIEFGSSGYIKAPPAVADGILVIGKMSGTITAIASDPELFVKQGDVFLEKGESEKALTSYKKAQELYEKKGSSRAQEIQKKIQELETPSAPAQSEVPPEPPISPPPVQFNPLILLSAVVVVILVGILATHYFSSHKNQK